VCRTWPRADGAAQLHGENFQGQMRNLDRHAVSDAGSDDRGKITGLKPEQVEIHTQFLGGGFGRRANPTSDFVSEAVYVAKAAARR